MTIQILDPTYDEATTAFDPPPRLASLADATVGIVSNGKRGTHRFFDALDAELRERFGVADVVRVTKPNYSAPAGDEIIDAARTWGALIAGVGD